MKDDGQYINISVESLRNRITSRLIPLLFIALFINMALSLPAIPTIGIQPFMFVQAFFLIISAILYFARKRIRSETSTIVMLAIIFSIFIAGIANLGLLSATFVLAPMLALYLMLLGYRKSAYASIALILLYLAVMGVLFARGVLESVADPTPYVSSSTGWLHMLLAVGWVSIALVYPFELLPSALEKSEEHFRSIYENSTIGLYRTQPDGTIILANPTLVKKLGYASFEEIAGRNLEKDGFEPPRHRKKFMEQLEMLGEVQGWETAWSRHDGSTVYIRESARAIKDSNGRTLYYDGTVEDITERKEAEESLRQSEERFRLILDNMPILLNAFDTNGLFVVWNKACEETTGYKAEEMIGNPKAFELLYPDPEYRARVWNSSLDPDGKENVFELVTKTGEPRSIEWFDIYRRLKVPAWSSWGMGQDITERKQAADALRESEARFRQLAEAAVEGIGITEKGIFVDGNTRIAAMLGYELREMIGRPVIEFIAPESREEVVKNIGDNYEGSYENMLLRKDGTSLPVESHARTMMWGGRAMRVTVILDISERKRAEEQLQKLSLAVGQSPASIVITDTQGNIEYVNPKFTEVTGYAANEAIGANPRILKSGNTPPEDYRRMWETISSGEAWRGEFHNRKKNGELFWEMASISPVKNKDNVITNYVAVKEDITERKKLEEHFRQAQKMESIGTLAGGIAHDFNNILGIILGHSTLLDRTKEDRQKQSRHIEAITKATQRGAAIVRQLLTVARKTETLFETVDLNEIISEINKLLSETFPKTIVITTSLQRDLPSIIADAGQMHQVLLNLYVNARDAMPKGGSLIVSTKTVAGEAVSSRFANATAPKYIQVEIADDGVGMDDSTRQRVFEPFFTTKEVGRGTGLGLAVVFGIVERHSGFIDVRSTLGEGTIFTMYLPIPDHEPDTSHNVTRSADVISGGTETILVIEDEEMLRNLVKGILTSKGYTVLTAENGAQGVEMYRNNQERIAVVLSDMGLPTLSGQDVLKKIRKINPNAKVMMASGFFDPESKSDLIAAGAKHFIQKPYLLEEVLMKIREVLDGK
ncbi:MAG TPA: PAS domain S-box protein [Bacteroidota bacterium]|nr:PAS domain S-box protein [Bacteroidota bacterium]